MELIFFILLTAGTVILKMPELKDCIRLAAHYLLSWRQKFVNEEEWKEGNRERFRNPVSEHIRRLLQVSLTMGTKKSVQFFYGISAGLGAVVFLLTVRRLAFLGSVMACIMGLFLPYLGLRCLIQGRQVAGSHEGEILVTEILNNYKINYCNMIRAVEVTAMTMEGAPYSRKLLFNLSRGLNRVSGSSELKLLLEEFRFAMGTSWADILADDIYLACQSGIRVTESLSDLAKSMEQVRKIEEFSRRENSEARAILRYLIPLGSVVMTVGGIHFFSITPGQWFHYQFQTETGIIWFLMWLLTWITAAGVHLLLTNRKFDL